MVCVYWRIEIPAVLRRSRGRFIASGGGSTHLVVWLDVQLDFLAGEGTDSVSGQSGYRSLCRRSVLNLHFVLILRQRSRYK